jgi:cell division protein FtsQ
VAAAKAATVAGGRSRSRSRPRARAASAVVPFPRSAAVGRPGLARLAPSGRSLLTGVLILLTGIGLYAAARGTSAFAVKRLAVDGASPEVAAQVQKALTPVLGESLMGLDVDELGWRVASVPMVASVSFDRAFPNTLRIEVREEVPVAVLRQGASSWLAASGGRVVAELDRGARLGLPRIWLGRDIEIRVGESVGGLQRRAVVAVAPLVSAPLPLPVASVASTRSELTLVLRNRLEIRLGDATELSLKLEVARRVLPQLAGWGDYLDVSVPERPVAGETLNSQVEVETLTSTSP